MHGLGNYHSHNRWCDGKGEIAEVIEAAIAAGLTQIGISSHAPVPFPARYALPLDHLHTYRSEVLRLRARYRDQIDVLLGLELDALPALREWNRDTILTAGWDYAVGSIHFLRRDADDRPWPLDLSSERFIALLRECYAGDIRALVEEYYRLVAGLADYPGVAIVGHIDRGVRRWNDDGGFFDEDASWYRDAVDGALQALAVGGQIIELSTGGWRLGLRDPFPSAWVVRRCASLGIPMTICSDSHQPRLVTYDYPRALALLRASGHREIARFNNATGAWCMVGLPPG